MSQPPSSALDLAPSAGEVTASARSTLKPFPARPADVPERVWPKKAVGKKIYITFGGEVYDGTTALIAALAPKFGADEVRVYDDNWLMRERADFVEHNRWLWDHPHKRGFGWYAWKPFIVLDALERAKDGDVVMFTDADTFPVDDFSVLYETCARDGGVMLFKAGGNVNRRFTQAQWCKRDCYIAMNQDEPRYYEAEAGVARFMLFQKGQWRAQQFLMEWLTYCVNPLATTFDPSILADEPEGFVEHRTEQAIMTNLAHKYGFKLYREACELGNAFPEDKALFPQLFSQSNPWGNKTAPCVGSRFRNVDIASAAPAPIALTDKEAALACQSAQRQVLAGRLPAAERIVTTLQSLRPDYHQAAMLLGQIRERARDFQGALAAYERAIELNPGHAQPFTRRAILKLRLKLGNPRPARVYDPAKPWVAMPTLGRNGRFGNQLLQYGLLRLYAAKVGAQVLAPDWIGRDLFACDDPVVGNAKPQAVVQDAAVTDVMAGRIQPTRANVELGGYFCGPVADWAEGKDTFQKLFEPVGKVRSHADAALRAATRNAKTLVAIHLRRGDYGQGQFWIAPTAWYLGWLAEVWPTLERPALFLATDDATLATEFAAYQPVTSAALGEPLPGVEFFSDHWVMRHADLLATSNSTFSGTAALLNRKPRARFWRPDRTIEAVRPFDPWSENVLLD